MAIQQRCGVCVCVCVRACMCVCMYVCVCVPASPCPPRRQCSPWLFAAPSRWPLLSVMHVLGPVSYVPVQWTPLCTCSWKLPVPSSGYHSNSFGLVRSGYPYDALGTGPRCLLLKLCDCSLQPALHVSSIPPVR